VSPEKYLDRIGRIIQEFKGHIRVEDYSDELSLDGREMASFYEASIVKAVAITNYFTDHNWFAEERIHPGTEGKGNLSLQERKSKLQPRDRRVEFTLTQFKTY
jgi:flagellar motor protein MotB